MLTQKIKQIRQEIFKLAKESPDIETMHWYMWLDDCFENDEFSPDEYNNLRWRCFVLMSKEGRKVNTLLNLITHVLPTLRAEKGKL